MPKSIRQTSQVVVFDTETTGLTRKQSMDRNDAVIDIGAVKLDEQGNEIDSLHLYFNPGERYFVPNYAENSQNGGWKSRHVGAYANAHKIKKSDLRDKLPFGHNAQRVKDFFGHNDSDGSHLILVAHNKDFDIDFMNNEFERVGKGRPIDRDLVEDTIELSKEKLPDMAKNKLNTVAMELIVVATNQRDKKSRDGLLQAFRDRFDDNGEEVHGALVDARLTAKAYNKLNDIREIEADDPVRLNNREEIIQETLKDILRVKENPDSKEIEKILDTKKKFGIEDELPIEGFVVDTTVAGIARAATKKRKASNNNSNVYTLGDEDSVRSEESRSSGSLEEFIDDGSDRDAYDARDYDSEDSFKYSGKIAKSSNIRRSDRIAKKSDEQLAQLSQDYSESEQESIKESESEDLNTKPRAKRGRSNSASSDIRDYFTLQPKVSSNSQVRQSSDENSLGFLTPDEEKEERKIAHKKQKRAKSVKFEATETRVTVSQNGNINLSSYSVVSNSASESNIYAAPLDYDSDSDISRLTAENSTVAEQRRSTVSPSVEVITNLNSVLINPYSVPIDYSSDSEVSAKTSLRQTEGVASSPLPNKNNSGKFRGLVSGKGASVESIDYGTDSSDSRTQLAR